MFPVHYTTILLSVDFSIFYCGYNKYYKYSILKHLSSEHIVLEHYYTIVKIFYCIKDLIFVWDYSYCISVHPECY
jgi:hypothetical protein